MIAPRQTAATRPARLPRLFRRLRSTDLGLPLTCGLLYFALGAWLAVVQQAFFRDAVSRTASAVYTVQGRDPHLAAIGFVWTPLPALAQVPLVPLLDPFDLVYLAGPLMSVAFATATVWVLDRLFRIAGLGAAWRAALLLLYALNPLILFYAVMGASEAPFLFFLLAAVTAFARWARGGRPQPLVICAAATAMAFLVRYEALALAAAGATALLLVLIARPRFRREEAEGVLLAYLAPFVYVVALWLFVNWTIMGDPLYFQRSVYGNSAQSEQFRTEQTYLSGVVGSPAGALWYSISLWAAAFPAAVPIVLLAIGRALHRRSAALAGLLCFTASIPAFHALLLYSGSSFGWLRFFLYSIPFSFVLVAWLLSRGGLAWRVLLVGTLALTTPFTAVTMAQPELGREEWVLMRRLQDPSFAFPGEHSVESFENLRGAAAYIDRLDPSSLVLVDSVLGFPLSVFVEHQERLAITSDRDFEALLQEPRGRVSHLLVPRPHCEPGTSCLVRADRLVRAYPDLWEHGSPWTTLEAEFGGPQEWRLYRIVPPEAETVGSDSTES